MDAVESASLAAIGLLREPVRRALYDYVASRDGEVSRNEAAEAVGVQRGLAAFHLDKLVDGGLLEATFRRLGERRGPGAGRPAKLYRRAAKEVAASLPPRAYQAAAHLLAEAVEQAGAEPELYAAARRHGEASGRRLAAGRQGPTTELALAALGYEPYQDAEALRLRNCPFSTLSREFPVVTCGMSLALIEGLLAGLGATGVSAAMDPAPGRCCVAIHGREASKTSSN